MLRGSRRTLVPTAAIAQGKGAMSSTQVSRARSASPSRVLQTLARTPDAIFSTLPAHSTPGRP
eukprot:12136143-Heterocapsa_arctica.AAC.1